MQAEGSQAEPGQSVPAGNAEKVADDKVALVVIAVRLVDIHPDSTLKRVSHWLWKRETMRQTCEGDHVTDMRTCQAQQEGEHTIKPQPSRDSQGRVEGWRDRGRRRDGGTKARPWRTGVPKPVHIINRNKETSDDNYSTRLILADHALILHSQVAAVSRFHVFMCACPVCKETRKCNEYQSLQ